VTISGTNLGPVTQVYFGGTQASNVIIISNTSIQATSSAGSGTVDVTVVSPYGTSPTSSADKFTYNGTTPVLTGIGPSSGPSGGGTTVYIWGGFFNGVSGVMFGGVGAAWYTILSSGLIVAGSPSGLGVVDITLLSPYGTSLTSLADQFTFVGGLTVTNVNLNSGPTGGGNQVSITGTGFTGATQVMFGTQAATASTVSSDTTITATAPPSAFAGTVDVTVSGPGGVSPTRPADQYTYMATAPSISSINPSLGPTAGGTKVVITGSNLNTATAVAFGLNQATLYFVDSPTQITAVSPPGAAGTVDIKVTTKFGISSAVPADQFTYVDKIGPIITGISPATGPDAGGGQVTINGAGFTGAVSVSFGLVKATSFTVNSDTQIQATVPGQPAGLVDVIVTTPYGSNVPIPIVDGYTYTATKATVTGVSTNTGTTAGGTTATLSGSNFTGALAVLFGGLPAASFTVNSDTSISAVSPIAASGVVDIKVVNSSGVSSTSAGDQFTYTAASGLPAVTGLSASTGQTGGTNTITVTGTNFTGAAAVNFGTAAAVSFTVNSATSITAVVPAEVAGTVDVTVATAVGISSAVAADHYTYTATAPTVTGLSATSDFTTGGTTVTITGTNFNGATAVMFGSTAATSFTVNSSTSITAVDPAGSAGTVDVKVTTPYGTSAAVAADHFTYNAVPTPTVTGLVTATGPLAGGDWVTATGTGFTKATAVSFGGVAATNFTVESDTQILAQAPGELSGTGDITVTDPTGTSAAVSADKFNDGIAAPTVSGLSVTSGPLAGGTVVTVTGTNFVNVSQVLFGGVAGTSLTVNSPTQLTVTAPAQTTAGPWTSSWSSRTGCRSRWPSISSPTTRRPSPSPASGRPLARPGA
jgi:hypothetical protein